ncbi:hypothetical protein CY34DRAFT_797445 [Suillus luteus UH-Slu-Lm8-n1]|uniref:Uncharacterized protein n=1 Tax=Suillus luteus UH-Slu-Lm8-n1 TaxID=930992 RepID=A0A0D0B4U3_9AGAM|nr:hypothetical protein CY34DRAFT_797445 [Suillus luteus UH-Slu-Lm8-n1]
MNFSIVNTATILIKESRVEFTDEAMVCKFSSPLYSTANQTKHPPYGQSTLRRKAITTTMCSLQ